MHSFSFTPSPFRSGWQLLIQLVQGTYRPSTLWRFASYRYKFLLRTLINPMTTMQWLNQLTQLPFLIPLLDKQPSLPCRLHKPYLMARFSRRQISQILNFHYQLLLERFPPELLMQLLHNHIELAQLQGKNEENYRITLEIRNELDKEGEVTLKFINPQHIALARMTFVFCHYPDKPTLFIGGLQGAASTVAHEEIQNATKACHGLFPKRLLLETALAIAASLGIEQIFAVGNQTHIYQNWRYQHKKQDFLYADYDNFWLSLGAHATPAGYYTLPLCITRKTMEQIASKKRAEYRRRYDLLDSLTTQITQLVSTR